MDAQALREASRAFRLSEMGIHVDGVPFDLRSYPYLVEIFDSESPDIVIRKGAQLGFTITMVLRVIDLAARTYPRGILYLMPTREDVSDFSKSRFDRLLRDNPEALGSLVRDTDATNIKRVGNAYIYFRGARLQGAKDSGSRSSSALKSIPVDLVVFDERDEMDPDAVSLAEKRLDGSMFRHRVSLSTATVPDFGVDREYKDSDARVWQIKCSACGAWTCLELAWPDSLRRREDGRVYRACKKCSREIQPRNGEWVAGHPGKERSGYWVSQLVSPSVPPRVILDEFEDPRVNLGEFYNSRLGLAWSDSEDRLDEPLLRAVCTQEPRRVSAQGPCFLGADVGKETIHYFIGERKTDLFFDVLDWGVVSEFNELHDRIERFNVQVAVLDEMAETRKVREFKAKHGCTWGCWYSDAQRSGYDWQHAERRVAVNRTEILDQSHRVVTEKRCSLPRPDDRWADLVGQMSNLARVRKVDSRTGATTTRWVVVGARKNDHWRHAFAYAVLAAEMAPIAEQARRVISPRSVRLGSGSSWMSA